MSVQDTEKNVYDVHLETAAMIQVAGGTGRIVVSDFWDNDAFDSFQLESFAPKLGSWLEDKEDTALLNHSAPDIFNQNASWIINRSQMIEQQWIAVQLWFI